LPAIFEQQRKALVKHFNEAWHNGQKAFWKIENVEYCLYINNQKFVLPQDTDSD